MDIQRLTLIGLITNSILFLLKLFAGLTSGSLAVLSDAFNSFTDIISSIFIHLSVRLSAKQADTDHPFGHDRAEPLAAFISSVFAAVLGFEILKNSLFSESEVLGDITVAACVLLFTIVTKSVLSYYFFRKNTPALRAAAIDSRNDVLTSIIALIGIICSRFGLLYMDRISAIIISLFIFHSAYRIGVENIDYLMGKAASSAFIKKVRFMVLGVKGVRGINELKAHYVGTRLQVEIHIEVDKDIDTKRSHDLGKVVQKKIESMDEVSRAFIHIDPV
jgi:cation diffusion facilitator family transporter